MSADRPRSGRVVLVGRPNVGKSTLLNALVGTHLSIVSPKPQTTRHRILGVCTLDAGQIAFVDTPGLHRSARLALNRSLNRAVHAALLEVDLAAHVIEAGHWTDEDRAVYTALDSERVTRVLVVNKIDAIRHPAMTRHCTSRRCVGRGCRSCAANCCGDCPRVGRCLPRTS